MRLRRGGFGRSVRAEIASAERLATDSSASRLRERIDAVDRLETLLTDATERADLADAPEVHRARAAFERLRSLNEDLYVRARAQIRDGRVPEILLDLSRESIDPAAVTDASSELRGTYDHLDMLVNGILAFDLAESDLAEPSPETIAYQPTPARHIFRLLEMADLNETDVFVDIGSGLGQVVLLAGVLSAATCIGIEFHPAYVACARGAAGRLGLGNVRFVQGDARVVDYSAGTVFYLYTPFWGSILRTVLDRLQTESASRTIRICTYGPVTVDVAREPWLEPEGESGPEIPALFRSRASSRMV